jgi:1,4-dihydroxy-2-naphthoate octaprenyltransferase
VPKTTDILATVRPPFLVLTPACVLLGLATAVYTSGEASVAHVALALLGALCAHISVNAFNEYGDFRSGLDTLTRRTPFSGGSGMLPQRPDLARGTLAIAIGALAVTGLVGLYFVRVRGFALLPLGLVGLLVILAYTRWITRSPLFCLIAPGLGFGLMVLGTDLVLTGRTSWTALAASGVSFFLVSNLLLLNQFPDVDADRSVGRKHLPITIGRRASSLVYSAFLLAAGMSIVLAVATGHLPRACLVALIAFAPAVPVIVGAYRHAENTERLVPLLGLNVLVNILAPVLVATGLFVG